MVLLRYAACKLTFGIEDFKLGEDGNLVLSTELQENQDTDINECTN